MSLFSTVSDPDVPTLSWTEDIGQVSVRLTWDFGETQIINSSLVYYIDVSSMSTWQSTMSDALTGLTPGHTYVYYLEVTSFDKIARSANHTVTTRKCICVSLCYFM